MGRSEAVDSVIHLGLVDSKVKKPSEAKHFPLGLWKKTAGRFVGRATREASGSLERARPEAAPQDRDVRINAKMKLESSLSQELVACFLRKLVVSPEFLLMNLETTYHPGSVGVSN